MGPSAAFIVTFQIEPPTTALGASMKVVVAVTTGPEVKVRAVRAARSELAAHARRLGINWIPLVVRARQVYRLADAAVPPEPGVLEPTELEPPRTPPDLASWDPPPVLWSVLWGLARSVSATEWAEVPEFARDHVVALSGLGLVTIDSGTVRLTDAGLDMVRRA